MKRHTIHPPLHQRPLYFGRVQSLRRDTADGFYDEGVHGYADPYYWKDETTGREVWDSPAWTGQGAQDMVSEEYYPLYHSSPSASEDMLWSRKVPGVYRELMGLSTAWLTYRFLGKESIGALAPYDSAWNAYQVLAANPFFRTMVEPEDPTESGFSLWYLVRDIRELPKLWRQFRNVLPILRQLRNRFDARRSFREVASHFLAYRYGLSPTLADMKEFIGLIIETARTQLEGKAEALSFRYTARNKAKRWDSSVVEGQYTLCTDYGVRIYGQPILYMEPQVVKQTVMYYYVAPELASLRNRVCQLVDAAGLLDPAVVWDLLPFSFIIDWFIDVSGFLTRNFKPRLWPVSLVLSDSCESIRWKYRVDLRLSYVGYPLGVNPSGFGPEDPQPTDQVCTITGAAVGSRKIRVGRLPTHLRIIPPSIFGRGLTFGRVLNGTALAVTMGIKSGFRRSKRTMRRPLTASQRSSPGVRVN